MLTEAQQEELYGEIMKFYDLAEHVIDVIERDGAANPELEIKLAEPVIEQTQDSAEMLAEAFIAYANNAQEATAEDRKKVETALRKMFAKILAFKEQIKQLPA
jgi:polyhydroxyalkanoate synthesis regulator protein